MTSMQLQEKAQSQPLKEQIKNNITGKNTLASHQNAVLSAIGEGSFHMSDIASAVARHHSLLLSRKQISTAASRLVRRGLAERLKNGTYLLTAEGRAAVKGGVKIRASVSYSQRKVRCGIHDGLRQRAWKAMQLKRHFTLADIVTLAIQSGEGEAEAVLYRYTLRLARTGYLERLSPGLGAGQQWQLARDSGDLAPVWLSRQNQMHDANSGEVFACR